MFTRAKIEFCGKERKFKRCSNKTLVTFQKDIEKLQEEMKPVFQDNIDLEEQLEDIQAQIDRTNKRIQLIESAETPTDAEIRKAIKLLDDIDTLSMEKRTLEKQLREDGDERKDQMRQLEEKLENTYAELACLLIDPLTPEEFKEEYDSIDLIKVQNLGMFYNMCQSGFTQTQIDKKVREVIKANMDRTENFRQKQLQKI
ncbi:MAG: hypothetical protein ACC614_02230 [Methanobacterium formicicum]|uniref:hypothetical protein n=1 Tax=Methanobacterium formicicum TaxID=2162 RepID=UPI003530BE8B